MHPGGLKNDQGTGQIKADLYFDSYGSIPREDVASVLKHVITSDKFSKQNFKLYLVMNPLMMY